MIGFNSKREATADKLQEPAQEPYAFDWLPEGATHLGQLIVNVQYGGVLEMRTHAFKYEGGVLMVYRTDNDNEYPEWIDAARVFVHTNFQVFPIAPPQPAQEQWNAALDEAAARIGEIKGFGQATQDSFAVFIKGLKR